MGPVVKGILGALVAVIAFSSPLGAQGRRADQAAVEAYYETVGAALSVSLEEVKILGEWELRAEETAVIVFVARRAGVSPDAIATQRGAGTPWATIVQRYGVSAGVFHIAFPPGTTLGPLEATYRSFNTTPRGSWPNLRLADEAVIALVNIRLFANHFGVPAAQVLSTWERVGDLVLVHRDLTSS